MVRLIKRYGSRKLYDTEESRYVLLEEIAGWIRGGQDVRVIDNSSGEDVTAQTLTQIISEEGRRGGTVLPGDLLHELIRFGGQMFSGGVQKLQKGVDRFVQSSIDRLAPVRRAREEMDLLRRRLEELEDSLVRLEVQRPAAGGAERPDSSADAAVRQSGAARARKPRTTRTAGAARPRAK